MSTARHALLLSSAHCDSVGRQRSTQGLARGAEGGDKVTWSWRTSRQGPLETMEPKEIVDRADLSIIAGADPKMD